MNEKKELVARYLGFEIKNEKEISSAKNPKGLYISAHTEGAERFDFYHKQKGSAAFKEGIWTSYEDLPFDTDWSWLMPLALQVIWDKRVVFKIEKTLFGGVDNVGNFNVFMGGKEHFSQTDTTKLVFEAVVEAIKTQLNSL